MSTANINLKGGITACVPRELTLMTPYVLLEQEDWFETEIDFIRALATEVRTSLDIGANFGLYSLALAKGGGPQSQVWAFEPMEQPRQYLQRSIDANDLGNINIVPLALSSFSGNAQMYSGANTEMGTLNQALAQEDSQAKSVAVSTLDEFCAEHALPEMDFLKIDAEGEEENVIRGGKDLFGLSSPLVMFEINAKERDLTVANVLQDQTYGIYRHVPGLNCLAPVDLNMELDRFQLNLFACKPDRAQWLIERNYWRRTSRTGKPAMRRPHWRRRPIRSISPISSSLTKIGRGSRTERTSSRPHASAQLSATVLHRTKAVKFRNASPCFAALSMTSAPCAQAAQLGAA